jgi:hypothetical protein
MHAEEGEGAHVNTHTWHTCNRTRVCVSLVYRKSRTRKLQRPNEIDKSLSSAMQQRLAKGVNIDYGPRGDTLAALAAEGLRMQSHPNEPRGRHHVLKRAIAFVCRVERQ